MLISLLPIKGTSLVSFEELFEKYKKDEDFFMIEEYNFDHIILHLGKSANSRVISEGYLKSIEMLKIVHKSIGKKYLECGLNIILKGNFLMVVPIYRPYASTFGRNLYPGPLWACGIVNLPEIPKQWPETVGDYKLRTPFRLLETSCKYHID